MHPNKAKIIRIAYVVVIVFILTIPLIYPPNSNWIVSADIPPSIANGGTGYKVQTNDWINALDWISKNTPKNAVIASWWDYGYWITTLSNRTSWQTTELSIKHASRLLQKCSLISRRMELRSFAS